MAGIDHATPHVLRHTAITEGVHAKGANVVDVSRIAGHKDLRVTMGYIHSAPKRLHEAVANLPDIGVSYVHFRYSRETQRWMDSLSH